MLDTSYRHARHRVATLASTLGTDQLRSTVPATPGWTVHQLVAHLVGGAADAAAGRTDDAGSDHWTARHVAERRHTPICDLLVEWHQVGPIVESQLSGVQFTGPNLAADLICHEADLHEALGLPIVDRTHWQDPFLDTMMRLLIRRLTPIASIKIRDEHGDEWHCGSDSPAMTLHADGYEMLRAMFSRRSRRQIAAWQWSAAPPPPVIDSFGIFGPRDDDQPPRSR
ncbi:maleylpyruvate isomerase N-terminal domain-containing protein [Mycobacterium sp. AMU20-3851]|uniref:maleylpyruvate isomerase N-terminal domain-containing protein n=1 Tax=Mycobacterium sp. AMU20-3851 TaxID=3122055 RepID=UPI0037544CE4